MEVCVGGDPKIKDNRRESYVCFGNDTDELCLVLKNVSEIGMKFPQGTDLVDCQIVADSIQGMSNFGKETFRAIEIAADKASANSCSANVLTARPVPLKHRFSLLRVLRMFNTPMVVFFCGINTLAVSARKGQGLYGFSFYIALALDNDPQVVKIHRESHPGVAVRLHTLGVS